MCLCNLRLDLERGFAKSKPVAFPSGVQGLPRHDGGRKEPRPGGPPPLGADVRRLAREAGQTRSRRHRLGRAREAGQLARDGTGSAGWAVPDLKSRAAPEARKLDRGRADPCSFCALAFRPIPAGAAASDNRGRGRVCARDVRCPSYLPESLLAPARRLTFALAVRAGRGMRNAAELRGRPRPARCRRGLSAFRG
jgi:hypothetical protein